MLQIMQESKFQQKKKQFRFELTIYSVDMLIYTFIYAYVATRAGKWSRST